ADLQRALYERTPDEGVRLAAAQWEELGKSQLMRMQIAAAAMEYLRACCVMSAARLEKRFDRATDGLLRASVKTLDGIRTRYAPAFASVLRAGIAHRAGTPDVARTELEKAVHVFDATGLRMYAAAARRRLGILVGGDAGRAVKAEGDVVMASENVVDPE